MPSRRDPWLAQRMRADALQRAGERELHAALIDAMTRWLDTARALLLGQPVDVLTAAADDPHPDIDAVRASFTVWARAMTEHVEPVIETAFGEAFRQQSRTADISPVHFQEEHMANVHDRLVIWPEGAFEELRPELLEALAEGEDYDQITDRVGRVLNIDALSRRIRADINDIDRKLADEDTPRTEIAALKGKRRQLWDQHDESLLEWQWKARRIARTEIHGAMQAGTWAAAVAAEQDGTKMYKAWLATSDERTRVEHVIAEGQIVPLQTSFSVAGYPMMYPGEPGAPAHLVIQCRCSMRILTEAEVQSELQGQWGGRGVGPGNARLGPDLADDITVAIDKWKREQRGEVVGDNRPPGQQERDSTREAPTKRNPGWTDAAYEPRTPDDETPGPAPAQADGESLVGPDERLDDPPADLLPDVEDAGDDDPPDVGDSDRDDDSIGDDRDDPTESTEVPVRQDEPAGVDDVDQGRPLNEQFDDTFADAIEQYTPEQRDAIHRWQGMDRFYQRVQNVVRDGADDEEAAAIAEHLEEVIQQSQLPADSTLWRGIRNSQQVFDVANADLPQLIGESIPSPGFLAATTSRDIAVGFTDPSRRGGHVLMELRFSAGTPVAWIAGAGDPELAGQFEALFGAALALHLLSVEYTGSVPTVVAEVIPIDDAE